MQKQHPSSSPELAPASLPTRRDVLLHMLRISATCAVASCLHQGGNAAEKQETELDPVEEWIKSNQPELFAKTKDAIVQLDDDSFDVRMEAFKRLQELQFLAMNFAHPAPFFRATDTDRENRHGWSAEQRHQMRSLRNTAQNAWAPSRLPPLHGKATDIMHILKRHVGMSIRIADDATAKRLDATWISIDPQENSCMEILNRIARESKVRLSFPTDAPGIIELASTGEASELLGVNGPMSAWMSETAKTEFLRDGTMKADLRMEPQRGHLLLIEKAEMLCGPLPNMELRAAPEIRPWIHRSCGERLKSQKSTECSPARMPTRDTVVNVEAVIGNLPKTTTIPMGKKGKDTDWQSFANRDLRMRAVQEEDGSYVITEEQVLWGHLSWPSTSVREDLYTYRSGEQMTRNYRRKDGGEIPVELIDIDIHYRVMTTRLRSKEPPAECTFTYMSNITRQHVQLLLKTDRYFE